MKKLLLFSLVFLGALNFMSSAVYADCQPMEVGYVDDGGMELVGWRYTEQWVCGDDEGMCKPGDVVPFFNTSNEIGRLLTCKKYKKYGYKWLLVTEGYSFCEDSDLRVTDPYELNDVEHSYHLVNGETPTSPYNWKVFKAEDYCISVKCNEGYKPNDDKTACVSDTDKKASESQPEQTQTPQDKCDKTGGKWENDKCICDGFYGLISSSDGGCKCSDSNKEYNKNAVACLAKKDTNTYTRRGFSMPNPTSDVLECIKNRKGYFEGMLCCRAQNKSEVVYIGPAKSGKCVCKKQGTICMPYENDYIWEGLFCQTVDNNQIETLKASLATIDDAQDTLCEISRCDLLKDKTTCKKCSETDNKDDKSESSDEKDSVSESGDDKADASDEEDTQVGDETAGEAENQSKGATDAKAQAKEKITNAVKTLDNIKSGLKVNVWRDAEGNFNTSRLLSDSIAGVVLGTAGGLITSSLVKKAQVKDGFEDIQCSVGGQVVAGWGDEFRVGIQ